jgi:hypothetical protein
VNNVGVGREASATSELLLTSGSDKDGLLNRSEAAGVEGAHVEDVDAVHLTENLETLETGRLLEIGGDGTGLGTRTEEVVLGLDLCCSMTSCQRDAFTMTRPRLRELVVKCSNRELRMATTYPSESCSQQPSRR